MKTLTFSFSFLQDLSKIIPGVDGEVFIAIEVAKITSAWNAKITSFIEIRQNVWLFTNQNVLTFSPTLVVITTWYYAVKPRC